MSSREGSLEAPTRHPLEWRSPEFRDEKLLFKELERVFDMFAKIERSVPDANGGLGIGLALSRQLAMLHDGSLVAHSAGEGHGATFTLSLPLVDALPAELAPEQPGSVRVKAAKPLKVVLVEDNEDAAELLEYDGSAVQIDVENPVRGRLTR